MNMVLAKMAEENIFRSKKEKREQAVKRLILFCNGNGMSNSDTARILQEKFYLSSPQVDRYMKRYWENHK